MNFLRFFHRCIHREVEHAGHRANFLADTFTRANEHGIDEGVRSEARLPHQVAQLRGAAETAKTGDRKGHEIHLKGTDPFQPLILAGVVKRKDLVAVQGAVRSPAGDYSNLRSGKRAENPRSYP